MANWDSLPLAVIICGFLVVSSTGAWAWANWWMKPRNGLIVRIFSAESIVTTMAFVVVSGIFAIQNYGLMPRSTMSRCELNSIRMRLITSALDNFHQKQNAFPVVKDWSAALAVAGIWPAENIPEGLLLDAGGVAFRLDTDGFSASLRSAGADRLFDTLDDFLCEKKVVDPSLARRESWNCSPDGFAIKAGACSW